MMKAFGKFCGWLFFKLFIWSASKLYTHYDVYAPDGYVRAVTCSNDEEYITLVKQIHLEKYSNTLGATFRPCPVCGKSYSKYHGEVCTSCEIRIFEDSIYAVQMEMFRTNEAKHLKELETLREEKKE